MSEPESSHLPLAPLRDLISWLKAESVPGVVIGGVAVAFLGRPRVTRDLDLVLITPENCWAKFLAAGAEFGFIPLRADALDFARANLVLLVQHEPSGINVDLSLGQLPFEQEMLQRAEPRDVGGIEIPLPTPEDLIITKAVAHRPRDMADIEGILDVNPKVDRRRIRRWMRQFAEALEMPELLDDLEELLARRPKSRRKKR